MGERRKWFDPKSKRTAAEPLVLPAPILNTSQLSEEDVLAFRALLEDNRRSVLTGVPWTVFHNLLEMSPRARLARNLKILIDRLYAGPVESIMQDGLNESEKEALVALEKLGVAPELRMTGQALLNVYERYQLARALGAAFV